MHQVAQILNWPTVHDLFPHVGMLADWPDCKRPASSPAESLAAPSAVRGACNQFESASVAFFSGRSRAAAAQAKRAAAAGESAPPMVITGITEVQR